MELLKDLVKYFLEGIICMSISGGIGMWILIERGTAEK